jgi:hypothetical protein
MTTDYNQIAKEYQASKLQPWRTHLERATLLQILGPIQGLRTIDWRAAKAITRGCSGASEPKMYAASIFLRR